MPAKHAKKLIHFDPDNAGALICDNELCGYVAQTQPFGPHLIDTPCPCCGSNLLTRRDYEDADRTIRAIHWINRWFGWLGSREPKGTPMQAHTHDGTVTIRKV